MKSWEDVYLQEQAEAAWENSRRRMRSADRKNLRRMRQDTVMRSVCLIGIACGAVGAICGSAGLWLAAADMQSEPELPEIVVERPVVQEPVIEEPEYVEPPRYTEDEREMLALVIYQEAGGDACSDECRQMVGEVVLNRIADERFPDNMYDVLTQKNQYGRLHWTGLQWPERAVNPGEQHAVTRAYEMADALLSGSVERLLPEDAVWQAEFAQGTEILAQFDGFYFCR